MVCAVTVSVCAAGSAPAATVLNANEVVFRLNADESVDTTFMVTDAVCVPDVVVKTMVPVHVVPAVSPA